MFKVLLNLYVLSNYIHTHTHTHHNIYLILPWDRHTACRKLGVEIVVCLVQIDTLHRGELLNVQHVLTVHCPRLRAGRGGGVGGWTVGEKRKEGQEEGKR